jgi:transposase
MTTKIVGLTDALGNLVRFTLPRGAKAVIAPHPRRAKPLAIDKEMYKWRHLIENFFGKLKEFKRIAMRADKTDSSFAAMIHIATAITHSR